jgi:hypothetical protein
MTRSISAIVDHGLLRPLEPLGLPEHELVTVTITRNGIVDTEGADVPLIADEGDSNIAWADVQQALQKIAGPLAAEFERERDERF